MLMLPHEVTTTFKSARTNVRNKTLLIDERNSRTEQFFPQQATYVTSITILLSDAHINVLVVT